MIQHEKVFVPNLLEQHQATYLLVRNDLPFPVSGLDEVKNAIVLDKEDFDKEKRKEAIAFERWARKNLTPDGFNYRYGPLFKTPDEAYDLYLQSLYSRNKIKIMEEQVKTGIELIAAERGEQIMKHGRNIQSDVSNNSEYQLATAAARLLMTPRDEGFDLMAEDIFVPIGWNKEIWLKMHGKPYKDRLIIAGALIAAEIDRLTKASHPSPSHIVGEREEEYFIDRSKKGCYPVISKQGAPAEQAPIPEEIKQWIGNWIGHQTFDGKNGMYIAANGMTELYLKMQEEINELQRRKDIALDIHSAEMDQMHVELSAANAKIKELQEWINSHI